MRGKVTWFNSDKGYGFIAREDDGTRVFVHYFQIKDPKLKMLYEDELVEFDVVPSGNGPKAVNVRRIS